MPTPSSLLHPTPDAPPNFSRSRVPDPLLRPFIAPLHRAGSAGDLARRDLGICDRRAVTRCAVIRSHSRCRRTDLTVVDTRRSAAAAKRPADDQDKASPPPPSPGEEEEQAPGADPAQAQSQSSGGGRRTTGKRAKVAAVEEDSAAKEAAPAAYGAEAAAEAAIAGSPAVAPPDTAGLQALTGAMDRLEAFLRSGEAVTNSDGAGHKRGADKDLSAMLKRAKDLSAKATSTKRQGAVGSSRRQEPWCRLISHAPGSIDSMCQCSAMCTFKAICIFFGSDGGE